MAGEYLGEIRMFAQKSPPEGWALCNGQLLQIQENSALYSVIGTIYGGDGHTTFALPNLQGRAPVHLGGGFGIGATGGEIWHALTVDEIPSHAHKLLASSLPAEAGLPPGPDAVLASTFSGLLYTLPAAELIQMSSQSISNEGSNQGHDNMMPYAVVSFCIAIEGVYPPKD